MTPELGVLLQSLGERLVWMAVGATSLFLVATVLMIWVTDRAHARRRSNWKE